jgi:site-specific recombinase XerD
MQQSTTFQDWLQIQINLGRSPNTVAAYRRGLADFLAFGETIKLDIHNATREHISLYVRSLLTRPVERYAAGAVPALLANATVQQRITIVRLYYDYLVEEGLRKTNPVGRGGRLSHRTGPSKRGLVTRHRKLPWIPTDAEWSSLVTAASEESLRNRLMFAFAYDAALRREELCLLSIADIDPSKRLLHLRAGTTKGKRDRVLPYSAVTGQILSQYLNHRRTFSTARGALFLSESPRNYAHAISLWTWSKVIQRLAAAADVPNFTTHSFRHLCLTDLARSGWELHEIATFAGHRNVSSTMLYIHLSGRELTSKFATATKAHARRIERIAQGLL